MRLPIFVITLCICLFASRLTAAEITGWRSDTSGRYPTADPPLEWSAEKHLLWKTELPAKSRSMPILVGERVFVTADPTELLCLNRRTGEVLWQRSNGWRDVLGEKDGAKVEADHEQARQVEQEMKQLKKEWNLAEKSGQPEAERLKQQVEALKEQHKALQKYPPAYSRAAGNTAPTPASDGRAVFVALGNGIVSAFDLEGQRLWSKFIADSQMGFGNATSPLVAADRLFVHYDDLVALDLRTGDELWRTPLQPRYGSLVSAEVDGVTVVITASGGIVRGDDGELIADKLFRLNEATPIVHDGVIYAIGNGRGKAVQLRIENDSITAVELWEIKVLSQRRFASPVLHDGLLYSIADNGILEVLEASTGKTVGKARLDLGRGRVFPSPVIAGDLLFLSGRGGTTLVMQPGRRPEEIARNELKEEFSGAPVFDDRQMFLRGKTHLYCISAEAK